LQPVWNIIALGLLLTIFTAFKFFTREKVVEIGNLEITLDKPHYMSWSLVIGVVVIGIGGAVLWQGSKK